MRFLAILPSLLLVACGTGVAPDSHEQGFDLYWNGFEPLPGTDVALGVVWEEGRKLCAPEDRERFDQLWGGAVYWKPLPFRCTGAARDDYSGCQVHENAFEVGWQRKVADTALVDELGHMVFQRCLGRDGEVQVNGEVQYDADFAAWVDATRRRIRRTVR
jgi:hypothetical protein